MVDKSLPYFSNFLYYPSNLFFLTGSKLFVLNLFELSNHTLLLNYSKWVIGPIFEHKGFLLPRKREEGKRFYYTVGDRNL